VGARAQTSLAADMKLGITGARKDLSRQLGAIRLSDRRKSNDDETARRE
jgi:hypothetical protein